MAFGRKKKKDASTSSSEATSPASTTTSHAPEKRDVERTEQIRREGPLGFRALALIGGCAMIVSNIVNISTRAVKLDVAGCVIAVYCIVFGFVIVFLEGPNFICSKMKNGIRFYAKFLEYVWGRGLLYLFCGVLQIANWSIVDWIVGGYMIFVGVTSISVGFAAASRLRELKGSITNDKDLKALWKEHDANGDGDLNVQELLAFSKAAGVEMTKNETSAAFMALDKNFDERLTYEEFHEWWSGGGKMRGVLSV